MKQVRKSIFETNSSSCHSLSYGQGENGRDEIRNLLDEDGSLVINIGEFGWGYDTFTGLGSRLSYVTALILGCGKPVGDVSSRDELVDAIKTTFPEVKEVYFEGEIDRDEDDGYDYGYVDHQSHDIFDCEGCTVEEFLLEPYMLIIDTDNH